MIQTRVQAPMVLKFMIYPATKIMVLHMEVPCCHGLTRIAQEALAKAGVKMTFEDVTIYLNGSVSKVEQISVN